MKKKWQRFLLFFIDLAIAAIATIITFFLGDKLKLAEAVAIILGFVVLLLMVDRFVIVEVGMGRLKEEIKEDIQASNCEQFDKLHTDINILEYFRKAYDLLFISRFDQPIMKALLEKVAIDKLVIPETDFYELVNNILCQFVLDRVKASKKKQDIEIMAVSFNDDEWKTTINESNFTRKSLEMVSAGVPFRRLFILEKSELYNMLNNNEYADVIMTHCSHNTVHIDAKIIDQSDEKMFNTHHESIVCFGNGFFCIRMQDVYFLIFDVQGDETSRGHVFIDQVKAREIIGVFNVLWNDLKLTKDFTEIIHDSQHGTQLLSTVCQTKCNIKKGCSKQVNK